MKKRKPEDFAKPLPRHAAALVDTMIKRGMVAPNALDPIGAYFGHDRDLAKEFDAEILEALNAQAEQIYTLDNLHEQFDPDNISPQFAAMTDQERVDMFRTIWVNQQTELIRATLTLNMRMERFRANGKTVELLKKPFMTADWIRAHVMVDGVRYSWYTWIGESWSTGDKLDRNKK